MEHLPNIFSDEQLYFVSRKAVALYNNALLKGETLNGGTMTKHFKLLSFDADEQHNFKPYLGHDDKLDSKDFEVASLHVETTENCKGIGHEVSQCWRNNYKANIKVKSEVHRGQKYWAFLIHGLDNNETYEKKIRRSDDIGILFLCYILKDKINTDDENLKNINSKEKLLRYLKQKVTRKFDDFPGANPNATKIAKYDIIVIGDDSSEKSYRDIKSNLDNWGEFVKPQWWNVSHDDNDKYLSVFIENKIEKSLGIIIYATNKVGEKHFNIEGKKSSLLDIIINWTGENENTTIPVIYLADDKLESEYKDKLRVIGEPSDKESGVLSLLIKSIQRYEKKDDEYNRFRRKALWVIPLALVSLFVFAFLVFKNTSSNTVTPNEKNIRVELRKIELNHGVEPAYLDIDPDNKFLYISNSSKSSKHEFYRCVLGEESSWDNTPITSETASFDFEFIDDFVLVSTDRSGTLQIGIPEAGRFKVEKTYSTVDKNEEGYADAIAVSPDKKSVVVTNWLSSSVFVISNFKYKKEDNVITISADTNYISLNIEKEDFQSKLNPSGVSFINNSTCVISLHTSRDDVKQIRYLDINTKNVTAHDKIQGKNNSKVRNFKDIKVAGRYALGCSDNHIYGIYINDKKNYKVTSVYGSPTEIKVSDNDKYALISHESHAMVTLIDIEKFMTKKPTSGMRHFVFGGDVPFATEGLEVNWNEMTVYVPNITAPHQCIYYFQLDAPETYFNKK